MCLTSSKTEEMNSSLSSLKILPGDLASLDMFFNVSFPYLPFDWIPLGFPEQNVMSALMDVREAVWRML